MSDNKKKSYDIPKAPVKSKPVRTVAIPSKPKPATKTVDIQKAKPIVKKDKPRKPKIKKDSVPAEYSSNSKHSSLADAFAKAGLKPDDFKN
jgi:hypothetical protein